MPTWRLRFQRWIDRMDRDPIGLRIPIGHVAHHRQRATNLLELSHCVPSSSGSYPTQKTVELSTDGWRITTGLSFAHRIRKETPWSKQARLSPNPSIKAGQLQPSEQCGER